MTSLPVWARQSEARNLSSGSAKPLIVRAEIEDTKILFPFVPGTSIYLSADGIEKTFVKTPNDRNPGAAELQLNNLLMKHSQIDEVSFDSTALCQYYMNIPDFCEYTKVGEYNIFLHNFRIRKASNKVKQYRKEKLHSKYLYIYDPRFIYTEPGRLWSCRKRLLYDCEYNIVFRKDILFTTQFSMREVDDQAAEKIIDYTDKFAAELLARDN